MGGGGGWQRRNAVRRGDGWLLWYLQNAENRLELSSGTDEAIWAEFLNLSESQMLMSQGAVSLEKTHTPQILALGALIHPCRCAHAQTLRSMQPVCCSGTTSAVRAILPSQHCYFLPFNISCPLSPFTHSSLIFPFIPLILQHPPPHPHPPTSSLFLCLSFSPSIAPTRSRWCRMVLSSIWLSGLTLWVEW